MNQTILLKRGETTYANKAAAIAALDGWSHLKGQPAVAFYTSANTNKTGDQTTGVLLAVGTDDGVGKYKLVATYDDFNDHVDLFNSMFELDTTGDAPYIKAKYSFYSTGEVSAYGKGDAEGGTSVASNLGDLLDVADNVTSNAEDGALLAFDLSAGEWVAISQSEVKPDLSEYAKTTDVTSAIATAKSEAINTAASDATSKVNAAKTELQGKIDTVQDNVDTVSKELQDLVSVLGPDADTSGTIDKWNEIVAFLDGYGENDDLSEILAGMNSDIEANATDISEAKTRLQTAEGDIDNLQAITVTAGNGLTGGGDLTANFELNVASANDGITVNANDIQLNTVNNLTSTSTTQPLSAAQGKQLQTNITNVQTSVTNLGNKKITAGEGLSGDITLNAGGTINVNVDGTSIIISEDKLYVDTIDGGTF